MEQRPVADLLEAAAVTTTAKVRVASRPPNPT